MRILVLRAASNLTTFSDRILQSAKVPLMKAQALDNQTQCDKPKKNTMILKTTVPMTSARAWAARHGSHDRRTQ
jgi:hypothetical protein